MNHIIIRTCVRDEKLANLCYRSFMDSKIQGNFFFSAEVGNYTYLKSLNVPIHYRPFVDNYGGKTGVQGFVDSLKFVNCADDDIIIVSDSDIIILDYFLHLVNGWDHAGYGAERKWANTKMIHISGQMQIFNGKTFNKIKNLNEQNINLAVQEMIKLGIDVADDTFNSYLTDLWKCKKFTLHDSRNYWRHFKAYDFALESVENAKQKVQTLT